MGLDADLVCDAQAARERLIESQRAAEQTRADYHHAIRRLHAASGSLREIAEALRLSHKRARQVRHLVASGAGVGAWREVRPGHSDLR
jgi:hypothetical protein